MKIELLLGDEAVGLAAIDAGIGGAFSYPGTPATEIFEFISARTRSAGRVSAAWSANEKVAYEEALGMSYAGKRAIVSMKHVGLNVAADPFMNSALTGVNGGLVLVVADDPGMHSSQNEQDSRYYGEFAQIPMLEPCNQQESYDMTRAAFELSESLGLPIMLRLVTRLAHSRGNVQTRPPIDPDRVDRTGQPLPDPNDWTLVPSNARRRFRHLLSTLETQRTHAEQSAFNNLALRGNRGIIASGIAYNYVREVCGPHSDESLLKIGCYPLPAGLIRDLVNHCDEILIVEEGYPFIETRLNGLLGVPGKAIRGKINGPLSLDGELTPDTVATALGRPQPSVPALDDLANRPPQLCQGCPHADTFKAILDATAGAAKPILFSDIGCYTLGALPPYRAVHSCVDMGASISMAHGAAQAGAHPVLCTIGDSTFTHSGMTPLIGAARSDADMTVFVLDNATVAMTGSQETMACGDELLELIKGLGVKEEHLHVMEPLPRRHQENVQLVARAINHRGLSVVVAQRACIHARRRSAASTRKETAKPAEATAGA
ncbi:MAG: indolepyruvate ferredoxin oxidoreductase [Planctomycetes bacterium]|nr:indolepyruvate ferredoxin oxidoreductase [Planctomycetota bacterium]